MAFLPIDLTKVDAATGFDYPPGYYIFQIAAIETRTNNNGDGQRLLVHNQIVMGPGHETKYASRKLANSYQLSEKGAAFLKRLFISCGITDEFIAGNGGADPDWLIGRQYVAQVIKNGSYTNITNERPTTDWEEVAKQGGNGANAMAAPAPVAPPMVQPVAAAPVMPPVQPVVGIPAPPPPPAGKVG